MIVATIILFLLPTWLLWVAGSRLEKDTKGIGVEPWRNYFGKAALALAVCTTLLELIFFFSWFHNGGSPHGMNPSDGLWTIIRRFILWILVASLVLSAFTKGWFRLLIPAWAAGFLFVAYMLFALEAD